MTFYQQTEYSLLDNLIKIEKLVSKAKEYNYEFLTITDNNLHGFYKFYNLCTTNNIKPIIGIKLKITIGSNIDYILAYAFNNKGFKDLIQLLLIENVNIEDIKNKENLFFITSGIDSLINKFLISNDYDNAKYVLGLYEGVLNLYLGLSLQNDNLIKIKKDIFKLKEYFNLKILPVRKVSYLSDDDLIYYNYLRKVGNLEEVNGSFKLLNKEEIKREYFNINEVFINTNEIISKVNYNFNYNLTLPKYINKYNLSSKDYLKQLSIVGLNKRMDYNHITNKKIYYNRLKEELKVITDMKYEDYFLIVYDFVNYAKKNNILVGPGRGSAAGSLVSYSLGITNIDPIKYNLLFERFLNKERISMPDIDIDFEDTKREQVINYLKDKYGSNHVSYIVTFGEFLLRSSIRDMGRSLNIDNSKVNELIKYIDKRINTFEEAIKVETVKYLYQNDKDIKQLLDFASRIEGLPRHISTHAAGIILSSNPLNELIPLSNLNNLYQTQIEAKDLEQLGFLKIDLLGIKNLTIINNVFMDIKDIDKDFSLDNIPLDDSKTYSMLQNADVTGVFQLESYGIRNVLRKLKPSNFMDISSVLALYRPGPMDNIDTFINNKKSNDYDVIHPLLKDILKETYGVIVYQEQIMSIVRKIANFTLGEADILRRGMSKKDLNLMNSEKEKFIKGALSNNVSFEDANKIFDYILKFANYGFNKSHSVSYAMISYQMLYLKSNYPLFFLKEMLNNAIGSKETLKIYLDECLRYNIYLSSPNINLVSDKFKIFNNNLVIPLVIVKNVGLRAFEVILEERVKRRFEDYYDFINRVKLDNRSLENLIYAGFFDVFNITKKEMISSLEEGNHIYSKYNKDMIKKEYNEYDRKYLYNKLIDVIGFDISKYIHNK